MESKRFLYLQFIFALMAFENAHGLKFGSLMKSVSPDQTLNLTWTSSPSDPPEFNVKAVCNNNFTVTLQNSVQKSEMHLSIPLGNGHRLPLGSCFIQATFTSNTSALASSPTIAVLAADPPTSSIHSSSVLTNPTKPTKPAAATITTPTVPSLPQTSTPSPSAADTTSSSSSSFSSILASVAFQSSSNSVLTQASAQLTTDIGMSVSGQTTAIMETFTTTDSSGKVWTITSQASVNIAGGFTSAPSGFTVVEETTTITFISGSSTGVTTVTFTTDVPTQSAGSSDSTSNVKLKPSQVGSIIGGTLGSVVFLALLILLACIKRRRKRPNTTISPMDYDPSYNQPSEKPRRSEEVLPLRETRSSPRLDGGPGCSEDLEDLEAIPQEMRNDRCLRWQIHDLREQISQLKGQQREWLNSSTEYLPPYSVTTDSYTYEQQIHHA